MDKQDSSTTNKGDLFQSSSLTTGYFYGTNQQASHQTQDHQAPSHQELISPQQSSRRRAKPPAQSTSNNQPESQPEQSTQSPQRKPKPNPRRTYKKTTHKRNIQQLQHELETLDDQELQKHDMVMLSKESAQNTDRDAKEKVEEVFQLDDLEAEFEVEQMVDLENEQNAPSKQPTKLAGKKRNLPLKVHQQVVFQQSSDEQGESPQRLQQPKLIPQSSQSLSSPQKQSLSSPQKQPSATFDQNPSQLKQQPAKVEVTREHMFKILTYPVKANMVMKANVQRVSGFLFNTYPEYHVYFEADQTHLISAKRVSRTPFSTFIISRSKTDFQENSHQYLGKAKGSAIGDILNLYGSGYSPANALLKKIKPRQLLATVVYETRILLAGQPRHFKVYIKKPQVDYYMGFPQVKIYGQQIPLNLLYQNPHNRQKIIVLQSKKPEYNSQIKGYSLNFRGRVGQASVKNFVLENAPSQQVQEHVYENDSELREKQIEQSKQGSSQQPTFDTMIFGKAKNNLFNMDLSSPLSPLIAFGIALSTFDEKYFCE